MHNIKYLFTTLAVGRSYLHSALDGYIQLSKFLNCDFNITTDELSVNNINNINFDKLSLSSYNDDGDGFSFYVNLKALALKYALDKNYDFVIYHDADWRFTKELTEEKLLNTFQHMIDNNHDMLFERPAQIQYYKNNLPECFFTQKLFDYDVFDHDKWDDAHVMNEQFFIFRITPKYKFFVKRWEQFLWYSIANNIRNYAEGFEIGVSALEANMNLDFQEYQTFLRGCFEFNDKEGRLHTRF